MVYLRRFYFVRCNDGETFDDASLETLVALLRQQRIDRDTPILDQISHKAFFPEQHPWLKQKLTSLRESSLSPNGEESSKGISPRLFRWIEGGQLLVAIAAVTIAALALILAITTRGS